MLRALVVLSLLCGAGLALPEQVCLKLDPRSSSLAFDASVGPLPLSGTFTSYQSGWAVAPQNPEASVVSFEAQPTSFRLAGNERAGAFLDTLLRTVPPDPVVFRSSAVRRVAGRRFVVEGVAARAGRRRTIRVPIDMLWLSPEGGEIRAVLEGSVFDLIPGTQTTGSVTAHLTYRRGNPSNCP